MTAWLMAAVVPCYVGCNTGSPELQALHVLECDTETGAARIVQSVKGLQGTIYFQLDRDGRFLYSGLDDQKDGGSVGSAVRFPVGSDGRLGPVERLAELPCEAPCHVSLTPDGKRVAFAAYRSGTCGTVGVDGRGLKTYVFPDDATGPNRKRQQKAYAHQTFFLPDGTLGVVDLGCDRIRFFDPVTMAPAAIPDIAFDPGDGPRHALFSKDGRFLFVVCELGSCVYALSAASQPRNLPAFTRLCRVSMLPAGFNRWEPDGETLATKASAVKLTADGKILMASNRGHDSIAFFDVGEDGRLSLRTVAKLTGRFPRDFELMPGEKFMVVGHKLSDEIQVYRFDRAACTLEPAGAPIPAWRPLCFTFGK